MDAFMNGFEFVLLAMRGRLVEADLPDAERARLEGFLADYSRIADAYRARQPPKASPFSVISALAVEVPPTMAN